MRLFPVIGPAIRKSIAETFKTLVQSLNQTMEYSLSPRGIKWRMEAARAGIPLGEYILRKTLVYRIEQVYLIQKERGLMAGHVQNESAVVQDADAVSAMFTAIQDFVSDSFSPEHDQHLETADIGEFTVWVLQGPHSMMACVIRGVPPRGLRDQLSEVLERINGQYGEALKRFDGDPVELEGVEDLLADCLLLQQRGDADASSKGGLSLPLKLILLVLGAGLAWWAVSSYLGARQLDALRQVIADTPGLVATDLNRAGGRITVHGLADPLADDLATVTGRAGIAAAKVDGQLRAFQSLEPEIILRRAGSILKPPESVQLSLRGDTLVATGRAEAAWRSDFASRARLIPGVVNADASGTRPSDEDLLRQAREMLEPPSGVTLAVAQQVLRISGVAPQAWIGEVSARVAPLADLHAVVTDTLQPAELERLEYLVRELNGREFYFESGARLLDARGTALASTATRLQEAFALGDAIGRTVNARVVGHADGLGGRAENLDLMRRRALAVVAEFVANGIPGGRINAETAPTTAAPRADARERKAVLLVSLTPDSP